MICSSLCRVLRICPPGLVVPENSHASWTGSRGLGHGDERWPRGDHGARSGRSCAPTSVVPPQVRGHEPRLLRCQATAVELANVVGRSVAAPGPCGIGKGGCHEALAEEEEQVWGARAFRGRPTAHAEAEPHLAFQGRPCFDGRRPHERSGGSDSEASVQPKHPRTSGITTGRDAGKPAR